MKGTTDVWKEINVHMKPRWKVAFFSAFLLGLLIHMPIMLSDIPNHDGLASIYFDQNMITSGRWFLTIACGISSYFTLPWVIGLLAIVYLSVAAVIIVEFLEVENKANIIVLSGLLVSFPALASTFAYVFTLDGYMLGILLAVSAPLLTKKYKYGFIMGGICLAFSLGIYQSYLPFAMLLSLYGILQLFLGSGDNREKGKGVIKYALMGIEGLGLYYVILQILLKIQGKQLADYQGISDMGSVQKIGLIENLKRIYHDFFAFGLKGGVLYNSAFSAGALVVLGILVCVTLVFLIRKRKLWKSGWFYVISVGFVILIPICTNAILIISPNVTFHVLMKYHWVLFIMLMIAFTERYVERDKKNIAIVSEWALLIAAGILVFHYAVTDNIAYSNLEKKYEKTYSLCNRLADRMEQTEGYYQGIPVAMIGVVGEEQYPETDVTQKVTAPLIGMSGDYLLYTRTNYQAFMKNYLGITINLVTDEEMVSIYDSEEYQALDSFPGRNSMKVVDGILYIKLENSTR